MSWSLLFCIEKAIQVRLYHLSIPFLSLRECFPTIPQFGGTLESWNSHITFYSRVPNRPIPWSANKFVQGGNYIHSSCLCHKNFFKYNTIYNCLHILFNINIGIRHHAPHRKKVRESRTLWTKYLSTLKEKSLKPVTKPSNSQVPNEIRILIPVTRF
jgi:hypothetical protein